jgi:hypothetical protein
LHPPSSFQSRTRLRRQRLRLADTSPNLAGQCRAAWGLRSNECCGGRRTFAPNQGRISSIEVERLHWKRAARPGTRDFAVRGSSCARVLSCLCADGWPAFLRANGLVKNLPNQTIRAGGRCHPRLGRTRGARRAGDRRRRRSCPWPSQKRFAAFCGLIEDAPQLAVALWTARDCSSLPHSPSVGVTGRHHGAGAGTQRIALGCAGAESWAEGARFGPRCGSTPPSEPRRRHAAGHQPGSKSSRSLSRTMIGIETPQWQQTDAAVRRPPSARRCERCVSPGSES